MYNFVDYCIVFISLLFEYIVRLLLLYVQTAELDLDEIWYQTGLYPGFDPVKEQSSRGMIKNLNISTRVKPRGTASNYITASIIFLIKMIPV